MACNWSENGRKAALARWGAKPDTPVTEKRCSLCSTTKPAPEFDQKSDSRDGRHGWCRACKAQRSHEWYEKNKTRSLANSKAWAKQNPHKAVDYHRKKRYNVTPEQYAEMLERQQHRCAICERHESEFKRQFHVDHDHETGCVRELLCGSCNKALGNFHDNIHILMMAMRYLEKHSDCGRLEESERIEDVLVSDIEDSTT